MTILLILQVTSYTYPVVPVTILISLGTPLIIKLLETAFQSPRWTRIFPTSSTIPFFHNPFDPSIFLRACISSPSNQFPPSSSKHITPRLRIPLYMWNMRAPVFLPWYIDRAQRFFTRPPRAKFINPLRSIESRAKNKERERTCVHVL